MKSNPFKILSIGRICVGLYLYGPKEAQQQQVQYNAVKFQNWPVVRPHPRVRRPV